MREKTVRACPKCGRRYLAHCYHDGEEIRTMDIPVSKAIPLLEHTIDVLKEELKSAETVLTSYKREQLG